MIERIAIDPRAERQRWLELRRQVITGTDVAAVAGVHPYKSALRVWAEKAGEVSDEIDDNAAMRRGRWMESAVFAALREQRPELDVRQSGFFIMDPEKRLGGTPDGYATAPDGKKLIVEAKTVAKPTWERDWGEGPPVSYYLQALTYAMLEDTDGAIIATLVIDAYQTDLHVYDVPRHPQAEARIVASVKAFWEAIAEGREPPADYSRDADILQSLRPPSKPEPVDLSQDNRLPVILAERARLMDEKKEIEARLEEIKAEIIDKLDGHERATCDGWKLTNTITHRKEQMQKATSFPVLRATKMKEEKAA